ncbi:hypothetical protein [Aliarcobacter butzleri]|uniref:hypothetical protein n=1 Tax=Aliarcobacter butzleri TaxID=28197 RepID=UPI0021B41F2B|nr:hypothetical protein [Aliarcobacter butzleri]MCT7632116.1 hypothetical protein [Aliarcobacter butzleri]
MKNTIKTELTAEELKEAKDKEFKRYLIACSNGGKGFNIDDFPLIKEEIQKQRTVQKQEIQITKKTELKHVNPVDSWLYDSLKEDIQENRYVSNIDRQWFIEETKRRSK